LLQLGNNQKTKTMTLTQLKTRQQTLLNLIANVGGKNNIRRWVDELMSVESKIEESEVAVEVVYCDDIDHLTQPWAVVVGGKEIARFATRIKCDRHIAWKVTIANLISNDVYRKAA
jgi:hypothetical protein